MIKKPEYVECRRDTSRFWIGDKEVTEDEFYAFQSKQNKEWRHYEIKKDAVQCLVRCDILMDMLNDDERSEVTSDYQDRMKITNDPSFLGRSPLAEVIMNNVKSLANSLSIIILALVMFRTRCNIDELERKPAMDARELIQTIKSMNDFERTEFGQALADCGVSVVLTRKLGATSRQTITGAELGKGDTKAIKGQAYDIPENKTFIPSLLKAGPQHDVRVMIVDDPMRMPTEDEVKRVNECWESIGRVSVPPIKSVKDYDATKKGSPIEE